jgi:hypothetical protein
MWDQDEWFIVIVDGYSLPVSCLERAQRATTHILNVRPSDQLIHYIPPYLRSTFMCKRKNLITERPPPVNKNRCFLNYAIYAIMKMSIFFAFV